MRDRLMQQLVELESEILVSINFDVCVELPYKFIDDFKKELREWPRHNQEAFMRVASNFVNDSFLTPVCMTKSA